MYVRSIFSLKGLIATYIYVLVKGKSEEAEVGKAPKGGGGYIKTHLTGFLVYYV